MEPPHDHNLGSSTAVQPIIAFRALLTDAGAKQLGVNTEGYDAHAILISLKPSQNRCLLGFTHRNHQISFVRESSLTGQATSRFWPLALC